MIPTLILIQKNLTIQKVMSPVLKNLYSFVPSIGISEIIRLPNEFSPHFQNNFLVGSLNGKSHTG